MKKIKTGSDFSGVGAFDQALERLGIKQDKKFSCDMDRYARQTYCLNFGEPIYYPENVYNREIPKESLDIYMTSPPCQSFSLAGKRKGEDSKNGVLFYNSHEFIVKNNPRYFIFENVKGLLSDDGGKTFQRWIDYLGGKSVNGNPVIFPHENSTPYHVYYQVLNAKHYGVPQNRERIFIIGIRDDADNTFSFPKPFHLEKRLKDVLESEVDEKYFLSDTMLTWIDKHREKRSSSGKYPFTEEDEYSGCITARYNKMGAEDIFIGAIRGRNPQNPLSRVSGLPTEQMLEINENGTSNALTTVQKDNVVVIPAEIKIIGNLKGDKGHNVQNYYDVGGISPTVMENHGNVTKVVIPANNSKGYDIAEEEEDSINFSNPNSETRRGRVGHGVSQTLDTACNQGILTQQRIRRLLPIECMRLMDFNEDFIEKTLNSKKNLYFQFVYSKFDINKKETLCNVKLKTVKDTQTPKNLETYVLCTTKECQKMDALMTLKQKSVQKKEKNDKLLNVSFAIELLGEKELKECAINTIKWTDCMETLYTLMKEGKNQVVMDISEIQKDKSCIEKSLKITLEENLSGEKLFITLILLKQIMTSKIYTYVKMPLNTQRFISSTVVYEKKSERLLLSYLKMEYTEQVVSDSMLYKQAGNSIVVGVLVEIIKKIKL